MKLEDQFIVVRHIGRKERIPIFDARTVKISHHRKPERIRHPEISTQDGKGQRFNPSPIVIKRMRDESIASRKEPKRILAANGEDSEKMQKRARHVAAVRPGKTGSRVKRRRVSAIFGRIYVKFS